MKNMENNNEGENVLSKSENEVAVPSGSEPAAICPKGLFDTMHAVWDQLNREADPPVHLAWLNGKWAELRLAGEQGDQLSAADPAEGAAFMSEMRGALGAEAAAVIYEQGSHSDLPPRLVVVAQSAGGPSGNRKSVVY